MLHGQEMLLLAVVVLFLAVAVPVGIAIAGFVRRLRGRFGRDD